MTALCFTGVTFRYLKYIFFTAGYSHRRLAFPDNLPESAAVVPFPDSLPALAADPAFPDSLPALAADMDCNKSSDLSVYQILAVLAVDSQLAAMSVDLSILVEFAVLVPELVLVMVLELVLGPVLELELGLVLVLELGPVLGLCL